jgi:hypothetical protein
MKPHGVTFQESHTRSAWILLGALLLAALIVIAGILIHVKRGKIPVNRPPPPSENFPNAADRGAAERMPDAMDDDL